MIVPDDLWVQLRQHVRRTSRQLGRFIQTHPKQGKCIAPAGEEVLELRKLVRALTKANRAEKSKPS